jgi:hypothetical protein
LLLLKYDTAQEKYKKEIILLSGDPFRRIIVFPMFCRHGNIQC